MVQLCILQGNASALTELISYFSAKEVGRNEEEL